MTLPMMHPIQKASWRATIFIGAVSKRIVVLPMAGKSAKVDMAYQPDDTYWTG